MKRDVPRLAQLTTGSMVGKYRLEKPLGRGGFGAVFEAHDTEDAVTVAIKVMEVDTGSEESFAALELFKKEVDAIHRIRHPNVVQVYESAVIPSSRHLLAYYTMEVLEGRTLEQVVKQDGAQAPQAAIKVARQAAAGLHRAHTEGIIHCDIKPANIFLTVQGRAVVMDFGVCALTDHGGTTGEQAAGTLRYAAPEQLAHGRVDARSDVFSLGAVLFYLLSGVHLRPSADLASVLAYVQAGGDTRTVRDTFAVAEGVKDVLATSLALLPEDRFETARAMAEALEATGLLLGSELAPSDFDMTPRPQAGDSFASGTTDITHLDLARHAVVTAVAQAPAPPRPPPAPAPTPRTPSNASMPPVARPPTNPSLRATPSGSSPRLPPVPSTPAPAPSRSGPVLGGSSPRLPPVPSTPAPAPSRSGPVPGGSSPRLPPVPSTPAPSVSSPRLAPVATRPEPPRPTAPAGPAFVPQRTAAAPGMLGGEDYFLCPQCEAEFATSEEVVLHQPACPGASWHAQTYGKPASPAPATTPEPVRRPPSMVDLELDTESGSASTRAWLGREPRDPQMGARVGEFYAVARNLKDNAMGQRLLKVLDNLAPLSSMMHEHIQAEATFQESMARLLALSSHVTRVAGLYEAMLYAPRVQPVERLEARLRELTAPGAPEDRHALGIITRALEEARVRERQMEQAQARIATANTVVHQMQEPLAAIAQGTRSRPKAEIERALLLVLQQLERAVMPSQPRA